MYYKTEYSRYTWPCFFFKSYSFQKDVIWYPLVHETNVRYEYVWSDLIAARSSLGQAVKMYSMNIYLQTYLQLHPHRHLNQQWTGSEHGVPSAIVSLSLTVYWQGNKTTVSYRKRKIKEMQPVLTYAHHPADSLTRNYKLLWVPLIVAEMLCLSHLIATVIDI